MLKSYFQNWNKIRPTWREDEEGSNCSSVVRVQLTLHQAKKRIIRHSHYLGRSSRNTRRLDSCEMSSLLRVPCVWSIFGSKCIGQKTEVLHGNKETQWLPTFQSRQPSKAILPLGWECGRVPLPEFRTCTSPVVGSSLPLFTTPDEPELQLSTFGSKWPNITKESRCTTEQYKSPPNVETVMGDFKLFEKIHLHCNQR